MIYTKHIFILCLFFIDFVCSKSWLDNDSGEFDELGFLSTTTTKAPKIHTKYDENIEYLESYNFTESDFEFAYKGMPYIKTVNILGGLAWDEAIAQIQLEEFQRVVKDLYYIDGIEAKLNDQLNTTENKTFYWDIGFSPIERYTCKEIGQVLKFLDTQLPQVRECTHLKLDRIVESVKNNVDVKNDEFKDKLINQLTKTCNVVTNNLTSILSTRRSNGFITKWFNYGKRITLQQC